MNFRKILVITITMAYVLMGTCASFGYADSDLGFTTMDSFLIWCMSGNSGSGNVQPYYNEGDKRRIELRSCTPSDAENKELELISSDESVISVNGLQFECVKGGTAKLTIRAKYRPEVKLEYNVKVKHKYDLIASSEPTYDKDGYKTYRCSGCGDEYTDVIPKLHRHTLVHYDRVEADCTTPGNIEYWVCEGTDTACGKYFNSAEAGDDDEITEDDIKIYALSHDWGPWRMVDANSHERACSRDPEHRQTRSHVWDNGKITTKPTYTQIGEKTFTCRICGTTRTQTIQKKTYSDPEGASINADFIELYTVSKSITDNPDCQLPAIPDDKKQFQIVVEGTEITGCSVSSGKSVKVTAQGLIKPVTTGTSKVKVTTPKGTFIVNVDVLDFAKVYVDKLIDDFIAENITDDMSTYQKVVAATEYVADNTSYSGKYQEYEDMLLYGCGDCWASTNTILEFCRRMGLNACGRNANLDSELTGAGHRNVIVEGDLVNINGEPLYYIADAGYSGEKPRFCSVRYTTSLFSFNGIIEDHNGGKTVCQYDGNDTAHTALVIPAETKGQKVTQVGKSFSSRSPEGETWTSVEISEGIDSIDQRSFHASHNLKHVSIPSTVTNIGDFAFSDCPNLTDIQISKDNPSYKAEGGTIYTKDGKTLVECPGVASVTIPSTVDTIKGYSFYYNKNMQSLDIPATVRTIGEGAFGDSSINVFIFRGDMPEIEDYAMNGLDAVVYYPEGNSTWKTDQTYRAENIRWIPYRKDATSISDCDITLSDGPYLYDYGPVEPGVTVKDGSKVLKEGTDYILEYMDNNNTGTGKVRVIGCNSYIGTETRTFKITPDFTVSTSATTMKSGDSEYVYASSSSTKHTLTAELSDDSLATLELDENFYGSYTWNITALKPGKLTITITDNYGVSKTLSVLIKANGSSDPDPDDRTDQMGEDGTPVGKGASYEAAEKKILSMKSDKDPKGTKIYPLLLRSTKQTKTSIKLTWSKPRGAVKYVLYGNKCGSTNRIKKLKTLTKNSVTMKTAVKKIAKGKYYKFLLVALDKDNNVVSTSRVVHITTKGGKVGNYKSVKTKAKKNRVTVKKGKTFKLAGKGVPESRKRKVRAHVGIRYQSANTKIATVSAKGTIKGKKTGTTYIYAYSQNGKYAKVKVTVK